MPTRIILPLLPLLPAVVAASVAHHHKGIPAWPAAAVGLTTYLLAILVSVRTTGLHLAVGDRIRIRLVRRQQMFAGAEEPCGWIRITVPVPQKTGRLPDLLCSLPSDCDVELCLTGFWLGYLVNDDWRASLQEVESRVREHFKSVALSYVKWQSPFLVVEADNMVGFYVPLEAPGRYGIFFETTGSAVVGSANRRMHTNIFNAATAINSIDDAVDAQLYE